MSSKTPTGKAPKGSVQVITSHERLQLRFRFAGKRRYVSLGFPDTAPNRKMAELKAREIELDMLSGHFDSTLAKYKPDYAIASDKPEITPKITPNLEELWQQYIDARKVGKSPSTLRMYEWMANHIKRFPYKEPTDAQHIFDWVTSNVPRNSAKRVMMHLTACCSWAKKTGLLELANPFEGMAATIKLQKAGTDEDEIHPFTREERDCVINAFECSRYYDSYAPLVKFLFFTGCRPSEAIALRWKNVGKSFITFNQAVVYSGRGHVFKDGLKTQKSRKFPINTQLQVLLKAIKPQSVKAEDLVFPSPRNKLINWSNFTTRAWQTVLESLPDIEYRNPYQTRHTFCSLCREVNIPSIQIAKWVGNSAQMIDRVYAKPTDNIQVPEL